jgi:hypothetical protein
MAVQPSTHHFRDDEEGVSFPRVDGQRSTSATGRGVFADAARVVDDGLAEQIAASRNWRRDYLDAARRLLEASLTSVHEPTSMSMAGLRSLHDRFVFVHEGEDMPLGAAVQTAGAEPIHTVEVAGRGPADDAVLSVPYRGGRLSGDALHRRLDAWCDAGTVEPTFAESIRTVMANPDWLDLSDLTVVILGAGAEMGPLHSVSRWGATVVPIDLERPLLWERVLAHVRRGRGRAIVPVRHPVGDDDDDVIAAAAGVNLITHMPEVATWLATLDGPLTLGNYLYADGATHVRVNMAADAITEHLLSQRDDVSLAVLATPTDVFAVPEETVESSRRRSAGRRAPGLVKSAARTVTRGRLFAPNYPDLLTTPDGLQVGVADCLVAQQGPNYALAKRLQRWRAATARERGVVTSINVAPPTRTRSVMKNRALAAAYAGAGAFGVEVFDPSTSNTLMAAMLVHDLRNTKSVAQPGTTLEHPHELFWHGAAHGGLWRNPYAARSVLGLAVVLGMIPRGA